MKKLYVYALFHANLAFSSVPKKKYPNIIDKCYWPMLDLIKSGHKIGFECPSSTLRIIESIDSSFINELKLLWDKGLCEVIGSGFNQNILPLIPYEVNLFNLKQGMFDYYELFERTPDLGFVNEQTYAGGLPSLYKEAGFKAIMMDWDNAAEYHNYSPELRYKPVMVEGIDGTVLPLVWNSSLNSYKFQRCIYNRMTVEEYIEEVIVHLSSSQDRSIILYGTDVELFDYRPVTQEESNNEIKKIGNVFDSLKSIDGICFVNPSEVLNYFAAVDKVKIETPESPIPCKNRDDYNVLRWAVSGRDDVWFNTECYKIYNKIKNIECLNGAVATDKYYRDLNILWGSDLRTKTTNDKYYDGKKKIGEVSGALNREYEYLCNKIEVKKDFVLFNPTDSLWRNEPYEMEFHFVEGLFFEKLGIRLNGKEVISQVESISRYRDGSLRTMKIVCMPYIEPYEMQQGELFVGDYKREPIKAINKNRFLDIETSSVKMKLAAATGGDIRSLTFADVFGAPLIGYLSPLYYDHVGHSNDYYSMGMKVICSGKGVINDTKSTNFDINSEMLSAPIRIPISCKVVFDLGIVWKTYYVYRDLPRVDVKYGFYLNNIYPEAFRLAISTINPQAFSKDYLKFSTVNGSPYVEEFYVKGKRIAHNQAVGTFSSARCCLGATEGWLDISDDDKGMAIITNKSELYSVPIVEYEEIKETYLMRIYNSISEYDETGKIFWRGHNDISFTLLGHKNNIQTVRNTAKHVNNNLICIYKNKPYGLEKVDTLGKEILRMRSE